MNLGTISMNFDEIFNHDYFPFDVMTLSLEFSPVHFSDRNLFLDHKNVSKGPFTSVTYPTHCKYLQVKNHTVFVH